MLSKEIGVSWEQEVVFGAVALEECFSAHVTNEGATYYMTSTKVPQWFLDGSMERRGNSECNQRVLRESSEIDRLMEERHRDLLCSLMVFLFGEIAQRLSRTRRS